MVEPLTLRLTATHTRRSAATAMAAIGAVSSVVLAIAMLAALVWGPAGVESMECAVEAPSEDCLARLPEELRDLPAASVGVWFYAENSNTKRSPHRYLKAEASWARLLPENASSEDVAKRYDGRSPSPSALAGELRMREATLPELWQPKSSEAGMRILALPLGLGVLVMLGVTAVMGLRSRAWGPLPILVTAERVSFGTKQLSIDDLMSIEVAPLRLIATGEDLVLPPGYELTQEDHERLVDALQTALARSRDMFLDD